MGIFNTIRKAFRKGGALPHEHGPRVVLMGDKDVSATPKKYVEVKIDVVKNPGTKADCVCGGGTCGCAERKAAYAKAVSEKVAKATATRDGDGDGLINDGKKNEAKAPAKKPVSKSQEKRIAIQKDIADAPLPKKPVSKKTITEPVVKKTPAKKVTKPVAKEAPKAEPKPAAKKPAPKKK